MSRARRALAAVIMAIAACALGIPLASSTTAYDYDGTRTTSAVGGSGATETPSAEALPSRPAFDDRAPGAYDDRGNVARASARLGGHRLAPNTTGVTRYGPLNPGPLADDVAGTFRSGSYSAVTSSSDGTPLSGPAAMGVLVG